MALRRVTLLALAALLLAPASASAAAAHLALVSADILGTLGGLAGSVFSSIGHAVLGAFSWTIGLASQFILTTIAALVRMLIPRSWVHEGLAVMRWIVAVPDYAGKISSPGGGQAYGFAGINALRDVFMWLGVAIAPLTLVYATGRAMIGDGDPVGIPVLRMLAVSVVIVAYPYWWAQASALADQVTNAILTVPDVTRGLYKLMDYAVDGVALGGWQLVDLGLMGAIGLELLGLIFMKVVLILLGALLYATGPVTIGLVATRAGSALARAWASAVVTLLGIGIAWATLFAVGALLIGDAGSAGPLIAGNSTFGSLAGGLLLAVAGVASLWLCLKAAKEAGSLLRIQLSGLLALAGNRGSSAAAPRSTAGRGRTTGSSLREYGSRLAGAAAAATGELALAGSAGAGLAAGARTAAYVGRRGLIGTAAAGARAGAERAAVPASQVLGRSRAGAVAVRMAKAGTASWTANTPGNPNPGKSAETKPATHRHGRQTPSHAAERAASSEPPTAGRAARTPPDRPRVTANGANGRPSLHADRPSPSTPPGARQTAAPRQSPPPNGATPPTIRSAAPSGKPRSPLPRSRSTAKGQPLATPSKRKRPGASKRGPKR